MLKPANQTHRMQPRTALLELAAPSFYWYDLETSGIDPRWHRVMQFAGIRTDLDLNEVGDQFSTYVKLPIDVLPDPHSCLVTGLTPQFVNEHGIDELSFFCRVNDVFSTPLTCVAGFNNLRFDDEFIRYGLYRHLFDPYAREWKNGNSRWDIIDLVRAAYALRPEGIDWPLEDGLPTFRLEALTGANRLPHESAHDALSDVRATVALARLLKQRQPKLFDFYLKLRDRAEVRRILAPGEWCMCLHVSGMFPRERHCVAPIVALAPHPQNSNSVIVADLGRDVTPWLHWDADRIREALFSPGSTERPGLKEVRLNRSPFVAPTSALRTEDAQRLGIDLAEAQRQLEMLRGVERLTETLHAVYVISKRDPALDIDAALYAELMSDRDRITRERVRQALVSAAGFDVQPVYDAKAAELAFRVRARAHHATLCSTDQEKWRQWTKQKLLSERPGMMDLRRYEELVTTMSACQLNERDRSIVSRLSKYFDSIAMALNL